MWEVTGGSQFRTRIDTQQSKRPLEYWVDLKRKPRSHAPRSIWDCRSARRLDKHQQLSFSRICCGETHEWRLEIAQVWAAK